MYRPASEGVRARGAYGYGGPPAGSIGREGGIEGTFGQCRRAGSAEHIYEGTQRDRHLSVAGIVEEEPLKGGRPVLQHANQLPRAQERVGDSFGRVGDS